MSSTKDEKKAETTIAVNLNYVELTEALEVLRHCLPLDGEHPIAQAIMKMADARSVLELEFGCRPHDTDQRA